MASTGYATLLPPMCYLAVRIPSLTSLMRESGLPGQVQTLLLQLACSACSLSTCSPHQRHHQAMESGRLTFPILTSRHPLATHRGEGGHFWIYLWPYKMWPCRLAQGDSHQATVGPSSGRQLSLARCGGRVGGGLVDWQLGGQSLWGMV